MPRKPAEPKNVKKKSETSRYPKRDISKPKIALPTKKKPTTKNAAPKKSPAEKTTKKKLVVLKKKTNSVRNPSYIHMISEALRKIHPKRGVGYKAIANYIDSKYSVGDNFSRYVKQALHSGLRSDFFQIAPNATAKYCLSVKGRKLLGVIQKSKKDPTKTKKVTPSSSNDQKLKKAPSEDSGKTKKISLSHSKVLSTQKKRKIQSDKKISPLPTKKTKKSPSGKKTTKE